MLAGRFWGKTRSLVEDGAYYGINNPGVRIAVVSPTFESGRDVVFEGESGLLAVIPNELTNNRDTWNRSLGELTLTNGTIYKLYSSEKPDRLRGPQHHRALCDEICVWSNSIETWDMLKMGLRLGPHPQCVVATTPKPIQLIRDLIKDPDTYVTTGSTFDNSANAPESFIRTLREKYEGTRLGRQELYAEILEDYPGALWQRDWIEDTRIRDQSPEAIARKCTRIVVAIDPAVTSGENSDLTGIVAVGSDAQGRGYVLADQSCRVSPKEWASKAIALLEYFKGDCIIGETNNGGDMIEATLRTVDENVPFSKVTATRGKFVRAEPIAALYEQHRIGHVGTFRDLEDQMLRFTVDNVADESPDRCDALCWGFSDLFASPMNFGVLEVMKADAAKSDMERYSDMRKVSRSKLQKPVVAAQTTECIACGARTVAQVGAMLSCSSCGAQWMGTANALGGGSHPRYNTLNKVN